MSLLHQIQSDAVDSNASISGLLLKTQLLANKLGSDVLMDWIRYESEGYPPEAIVPDYRRLGVSYNASFSGPLGREIRNMKVPSIHIASIADDSWNEFECRSGISEIEQLAIGGSGRLQTPLASNLIMLMHGAIDGYSCMDVTGEISRPQMAAIAHCVRSKILSFTIELENNYAEAAQVTISGNKDGLSEATKQGVQKMAEQIIFGNIDISTSGDQSIVNIAGIVNYEMKEASSLEKFFKDNGIPEKEAKEISEIIVSEKPASASEPLGKKAQKWLATNMPKLVKESWKVGVSAITPVLTEAAKKHYGLS